ncbi:MAG: hypothetical protein ACTSWQ_04980 [Candidatus Thorarchaeota archaeon]
MKKLSDEKKKEIADILEERQVKWFCPMCRNNNFVMLDGYFTQDIQFNLKGRTIGGTNVPSIGVACSRCGFISQHALGILGLLKKEEANKDE